MNAGMTSSVLSIASFYQRNNVDLGQTLLRLASGKKINTPSDNAVGYIRAKGFESQARSYENIKTELAEWENALNVASTASGQVLDNLNRMQELIYESAQAGLTQAELDAYQSEFVQLATSNRSLVSNTNWQGISLLNNASAIATVNLAPGSSTYTLSINPGVSIAVATDLTPLVSDAGHVLNLTSTERDAAQVHVTAGLAQIKPFIAKVSGYTQSLESQQSVDDAIIQNLTSAAASIMDINEAEEMVTFASQDIRRQTSLAMMAQANVSGNGILLLYGMKQ